MTDYVESIDNAITVFLRRTNSTQGQLAKDLGMVDETLSAKRKGVRDFKVSELVSLSQIIGVSLDELTGLQAKAS